MQDKSMTEKKSSWSFGSLMWGIAGLAAFGAVLYAVYQTGIQKNMGVAVLKANIPVVDNNFFTHSTQLLDQLTQFKNIFDKYGYLDGYGDDLIYEANQTDKILREIEKKYPDVFKEFPDRLKNYKACRDAQGSSPCEIVDEKKIDELKKDLENLVQKHQKIKEHIKNGADKALAVKKLMDEKLPKQGEAERLTQELDLHQGSLLGNVVPKGSVLEKQLAELKENHHATPHDVLNGKMVKIASNQWEYKEFFNTMNGFLAHTVDSIKKGYMSGSVEELQSLQNTLPSPESQQQTRFFVPRTILRTISDYACNYLRFLPKGESMDVASSCARQTLMQK